MATDRAGGTGSMWKLAVTSTDRNEKFPLTQPVAKIAVAAGSQVTVKAYMKKDHATNVGASLVCRVGQVAWSDGASDLHTDASTADTSWHEVTLTFNPTEAGVVEIEMQAWYVGGNSNAYIEDMTITQA